MTVQTRSPRRLGAPAATYVAVVVVVLVLWQVLAATGAVSPALLPQPAAAGAKLLALLADPQTLIGAVLSTAATVAAAFLVAAVVGVLIGIVIGGRDDLSQAFEPLVANLNAVPIVLLYPLLLGALGSGPEAKVIVGAVAAGLPIAIATHWAVRDVDPELLVAARSMGATPVATIRRVTVPAVLPGVFAGLRTGLGLAIVTVVAGEFLSAVNGIGLQLAQSGESFQTAALFAWLIIAILLTAVLVGLLNLVHLVVTRKVNS